MPNVAYVSPDLGSVTSTFVYREILALEQAGFSITPFATHQASSGKISAEAVDFAKRTTYLYATSYPSAAWAVCHCMVVNPFRFVKVAFQLIHDMILGQTSHVSDRFKLVWHFTVGCVLRERLVAHGVSHVHAHFAHVPTSIAMYGALLAGCAFSFTAHANDLFERPTLVREKLRRAAFSVCISDYNRRFLADAGHPTERVHVIHCGLDIGAYAHIPKRSRGGALRLLSVGRFVEKKGFDVLVRALVQLRDKGIRFECRLVGDGPLFETVQEQVEKADLADRVRFEGSLPQEEVRQALDWADIFVLSCVVAASGDQDGIPVALMEAMALGVPVVSTRVSGIPELIRHGENGLLAQPGDAMGLSEQLRLLTSDDGLASKLVKAARVTIEDEFNIAKTTSMLAEHFRRAMGEELIAMDGLPR